MKKLMIAASAALCATASLLAVESANIVGYTSKESNAGKFIILGAQFEEVTGGNGINGTIGGIQGVAYDEDGAFTHTAPQIQIPIPGGYNIRYYLNDGWKDLGDDNWVQVPGWCDSDGLIVDDEYTPGVAVWFKSVNADADVVVSGAVPGDDSISVECPTTFALRANAYPMAITLNGDQMSVKGIAGAAYDEDGAFTQTAPQIQIPIPGGYNIRYYLNDGWKDLGDDNWVQVPGWCDSDGLIVSDEIEPALGFWTKGVASAFTLTFTK